MKAIDLHIIMLEIMSSLVIVERQSTNADLHRLADRRRVAIREDSGARVDGII